MSKLDRILVVLPNWVGDVVMATPLLRSLRTGCPDAEVVYLGRTASLAVLDGSDWCDATILDRSKAGVGGFLATRRAIRRQKPDVAILLPNSFRTALLVRLASVPRRIGYARDGRSGLLTDGLRPITDESGAFRPEPMFAYYGRLLAPLGLQPDSKQMQLPVRDEDRRTATELLRHVQLDESRPVVMLNPGASFGTSKLWPAERYAALADALIERRGAQVILNAAPSETDRNAANAVQAAMIRPPMLNLAARDNSLGLVKALLQRCNLLVTNDTGARHLAAALGKAVVTIFGSTDPVWAQIDSPRETILQAEVPCGPCQKKFCPLPDGDEHHRCMTAISVEEVLAAAEAWLEQGAAA